MPLLDELPPPIARPAPGSTSSPGILTDLDALYAERDPTERQIRNRALFKRIIIEGEETIIIAEESVATVLVHAHTAAAAQPGPESETAPPSDGQVSNSSTCAGKRAYFNPKAQVSAPGGAPEEAAEVRYTGPQSGPDLAPPVSSTPSRLRDLSPNTRRGHGLPAGRPVPSSTAGLRARSSAATASPPRPDRRPHRPSHTASTDLRSPLGPANSDECADPPRE